MKNGIVKPKVVIIMNIDMIAIRRYSTKMVIDKIFPPYVSDELKEIINREPPSLFSVMPRRPWRYKPEYRWERFEFAENVYYLYIWTNPLPQDIPGDPTPRKDRKYHQDDIIAFLRDDRTLAKTFVEIRRIYWRLMENYTDNCGCMMEWTCLPHKIETVFD